MSDDLTTTALVLAGALAAGVILAGLVIRHFLVRYLVKRTSDVESNPRHIVLEGLSKALLIWSAAAGVYVGSVTLPLTGPVDDILSNVLLAVAILAGTLAVARIAGGFVTHYTFRHERLPGATSIFSNITRVVVLVLGLLVTLQTMGVSVGPLITAMGVGGLALALALQDTLSNLFAGLHVIGSRKVVPGDYVQLDSGEEGYVVDINWRNTSLRNLRNNVIVVPNAKLANAVMTNFYQPASEMSVLVPVGVSYASDLDRVEEITKEVGRDILRQIPGGVPDFEPLIRFHTFADFSINFDVVLRVAEHKDQFLVRHEFVKRLHERYGLEGIHIPFPIQTVLAGDDSQSRSMDLVRGRG